MPIKKSAEKKVRQAAKRYERNKSLKTFIKNLKKKTISILNSDNESMEKKVEALNYYKSQLDKMWAKGIFKKNKSSRLKSRIDLMANKIFSVNK
ncbi:MAG: 30S ribosomal protein S20 [Brevinematia bacterium]